MRWPLKALLLLGGAGPVVAQDQIPCRGQRIDTIIIEAHAPTVTGLRRVPIAGAVAKKTHVITRGEVVRGFLLLKEGDRCSETRRAESERVLRAQPFIADATVDVVPGSRGGVNLEVRTIDEASMIISGSVSNSAPNVRSARFGNSNLAGLGITASLGWRHEPAFDDQVQVRFIDHQLFGQPYVLDLASIKEPLVEIDRAQLSLPFRTDFQRVAWRMLIGESRGHAQFVHRDTGRLALGFQRQYGEIGGILRVGPPGKLSLLGLSLSNERAWPDTGAVRVTEFGFRPDTGAQLAGRFRETRAARMNALIGVRSLRFARVTGFDALRGTQDMPLGLQLGTLVGQGISAFGSDAKDLFVASDLYVGFGSRRVVYRLQAQGEGRRSRETGAWDGLVGSGRFSRYARLDAYRTRQIAVEWSGTSKVLIPHSLSLASNDGGIRGLSDPREFGGRRAIARVSEQYFIGTPFDFGDLGLTLFADAGQLWPGDIPYAQKTSLRGSVGAGLLFAIPMRSTRMWRLEFAAPVNREPGGNRWEIRLRHSDLTSFFWREPADVGSARALAVPSSVYSWP
ncbi:MAG TPA: BamA/TamA family outer membrane protein [Gemmatimonadaceae bacterium]|nr:BamA/TamA family outer membrane protein [Gemmatimonadaceae bacterium]